MIQILSNGSKWYGQEPDSINQLLEVLKNEPLDRRFEKYGNFIYIIRESDTIDPCTCPKEWIGSTMFSGNFLTISHVFRILTDEQEIINKLTIAIRENQQRQDYLNQSLEEPLIKLGIKKQVDIKVKSKMYGITDCVIYVDDYRKGKRIFECGSGEDRELTVKDCQEVEKLIKEFNY
jgi:hypothetical protein